MSLPHPFVDRQLVWVLDPSGPTLGAGERRRLSSGAWSAPRRLGKGRDPRPLCPEGLDRRVLSTLCGDLLLEERAVPRGPVLPLRPESAAHLLPDLAGEGRLFLCAGQLDAEPLRWSADPWSLGFRVTAEGRVAFLARGEQRVPLESARLLLPGLVVHEQQLAPLDQAEAALAGGAAVGVAGHILAAGGRPLLDLPAGWEVLDAPPLPCLLATKDAEHPKRFLLTARFAYGPESFDPSDPALRVADRQVVRRDLKAERRALARLFELGVRLGDPLSVARKQFLPLAQTLTDEGWRVEADGRLLLQACGLSLSVASGRDWFELSGRVTFPGQELTLPELLRALRDGGPIPLADGSLGVIPEHWRRRVGLLSALGAPSADGLRFGERQGWLLEPLLEESVERALASREALARIRDKARTFAAIRPRPEPPGFVGTLRPYQREALGWFAFLRELGCGGCLADDMGLGKTVQVVALLQERRLGAARAERPQSLVVAPRSLVFNWVEEARRFAIDLRVAEYLGPRRRWPAGVDVVVTSYGILRRDLEKLKQRRFDYVILDEAQAIKNPSSRAAKAACALQADHRLALSGTPVENHLGELQALFRFLNPGLLGGSRALARLNAGHTLDEEGRALLQRALRPFLLRRTKGEVLPELPPKHEQVLHCEMKPEQAELYAELRDHYRSALLGVPAEDGAARVNVLTALLRLRQAACHPGLLDAARADGPSAKLDVVLHQLREVTARGHKALVFSQFTQLLGLVRRSLEREGQGHAYLDGRTQDRRGQVHRFQSDPACQVFLISLKAGGVGLNLTAAEYVFILDPWWNPAAEAQAVDRAHRIGQTRPVFAYQVITRGTVEEKIVALQREKRALADAIVNAEQAPLRSLSAEDLELLLS